MLLRGVYLYNNYRYRCIYQFPVSVKKNLNWVFGPAAEEARQGSQGKINHRSLINLPIYPRPLLC